MKHKLGPASDEGNEWTAFWEYESWPALSVCLCVSSLRQWHTDSLDWSLHMNTQGYSTPTNWPGETPFGTYLSSNWLPVKWQPLKATFMVITHVFVALHKNGKSWDARTSWVEIWLLCLALSSSGGKFISFQAGAYQKVSMWFVRTCSVDVLLTLNMLLKVHAVIWRRSCTSYWLSCLT